MKKIMLMAVAMMFLALFNLSAEAQVIDKKHYVSVTGYHEISVMPDQIYLSITLDEGDSKGKVALEEQRKAMFQALKKLKIDVEKQLKVVDMESAYFRRNSSLAATKYELKVGSATEAREVMEALDAVKVPNVAVERLECSNLEEYRSEVRKSAIRDAKMKAEELAEAIGQSIGPCFEIDDYTTPRSDGVMYIRGLATKSANDVVVEEPVVEFKPMKIVYNVSARFVLNLSE